MKDALRFALVGCGRIFERHAQILSTLPGAKIACVVDVDRARAEMQGARLGVPHHGSLEEMLARQAAHDMEKVDVVSVLTPSGDHAATARRALAAGLPVVVEKPMALRLADADAMIADAARAKVPLFVVKQNRYNRPVVALRRALEAGRFGKMVMGTVRVRWCRRQKYYDADPWRGKWGTDGGVFSNQASHHVDLLQWMMGPVESVLARTATRLARVETEDTGVALLRFASGALGVIEATTGTRPVDLEGSISILGEKGTVEIGGFAVNEIRHWRFEEETPEDNEVRKNASTNPPDVYGFGHRSYLEHVIAALRDGASPPVDGAEGRKSLELLHAIYESSATGREVKPGEPTPHSRLGGN